MREKWGISKVFNNHLMITNISVFDENINQLKTIIKIEESFL